jgi:hypothetical protein
MGFNEAITAIHGATLCTLSPFFHRIFRVLMRYEFIVVFTQGEVLRNHTKLFVG